MFNRVSPLPARASLSSILGRLLFVLVLIGLVVGLANWAAKADDDDDDGFVTWVPRAGDPAEVIAEAAARYFKASDFVENDNEKLRLSVRSVFLFVEGTINETSFDAVKRLLDTNPKVHTLVLTSVPGSADDETNVRLGRLVRDRNLNTYLPAKGLVASGGTDLFLAGKRRILAEGARVGVHSWSGESEEGEEIDGRDLPRDDEEHEIFLDYYSALGVAEKFYWFTLAAAPASDIHYMNLAEHEHFLTFTDWLPSDEDYREDDDDDGEDGDDREWTITNPDYEVYPDRSLISLDVDSIDPEAARYYAWYLTYWAPNDKPIHILAQDRITYDQLLRAYGILDFYLTDVPGSRFGSDNAAVANAMANNGAILVMPNGADEDGEREIPEEGLIGQPLYQLEFPIEGSRAYVTNDFDQRDAGFEEILHLVHDNGIGTIETPGALKPAYQSEILSATNNALEQRLWTPDPETLAEWIAEGSTEQEYLAAVIDSYYGLWGAWTEGPGGMGGEYVAETRDDIRKLDPEGLRVVQQFFSPDLTYMARIHPSFEGTFLMSFDAETPYTHKSRYLRNVQLLGNEDSDIIGNDLDNILIGNGGDNIIAGGDGIDVVQFSGASDQYRVTPRQFKVGETSLEGFVIVDLMKRDGTTVVLDVEFARFTDTDVPLL